MTSANPADLTYCPPEILELLTNVSDPEIPVLTIMDLGVVREVQVQDKAIHVKITPTYSGCPAMDTIAADIVTSLESAGYQAEIELILAPAWSTDWISEEGRQKLSDYGITPPMSEHADKMALIDGHKLVKCSRCGSTNTKLISQFGSTACKALFQCEDCLEPFDYFKCLK